MAKISTYTPYQTTIKDTDVFILEDTVDDETYGTLWTSIKSTLKTYFDTLYGSAALPYTIYDLELSNNSIDANDDIDINTGKCADSSNSEILELASGLIKQLDATWAVGTNAGGLFSGSKAISTSYHVFLIKKDSDASIDAGFDIDPDAANIPAGYTSYRRLGSIMTDSSGNIVQFIHTWQDKTFRLQTKLMTKQTWDVPTTLTFIAFDVPTGVNLKPIGLFTPGTSSGTNILSVSIHSFDETPPTLTQYGPIEGLFNGEAGSVSDTYVGQGINQIIGQYKTNTSGEVYFIRFNISLGTAARRATLQTHGWIDYTL